MSSNKQRRQDAMSKLDREIKARDRAEKTKPLTVVIASIVVILVVILAIVYFATRNHDDKDTKAAKATSTTTTSAQPTSTKPNPPEKVLDGKLAQPLPATVTCDYKDKPGEASPKKPGLPPAKNIPTTGDVTVTFKTNRGVIPLKLNRTVAPCAVNSMVYLAQKGFYNDTICHRITTRGIKVLQCGDPTGTGRGGPGFSFGDEYPVTQMKGEPVVYPRGSVAMANSGPSTNGSQFFLNYGKSPLDAKYTYFGTITDEGLKTLDAIAKKGAVGGAADGKPAEEVKIETATVSK